MLQGPLIQAHYAACQDCVSNQCEKNIYNLDYFLKEIAHLRLQINKRKVH